MANYTSKIKHDKDWNEYRVRFFIDGVYQAGGDYYTEDKEDAVATAQNLCASGFGATDKNDEAAIEEQKDFYNDKDLHALMLCHQLIDEGCDYSEAQFVASEKYGVDADLLQENYDI